MEFENTSSDMPGGRVRQLPAPGRRDVLIGQCRAARQAGVTLVVSLIFLLLLTILGVTAMSTNTLQEKMASNMRDKDVAFQATESALRAAEINMQQIGTAAGGKEPPADATGSGGIWLTSSTDVTNDGWWSTNSLTTPDTVTGVAQPRYLIEQLAFVADSPSVSPGYGTQAGVFYYRLTGRSYGITDLAQVMLQETYQVRYK
jgi:type IV pilus assembly protein PilX